MNVAEFMRLPIMGILRGIDGDLIEPLVSTIESAGLKTIEITMNTKGAPELIKKAVSLAKNRITIGAGTVLNMDGLKSALDAGATFIVMPVLVKDVMDYCIKNKVPVFPGAFTPQEIYEAWRAGATMVKVFPSGMLGPGYFKQIRGPFKDIKLLACGGVTHGNMGAYFSNGASAVSFGASVFTEEFLSKKDFSSIGQAIKSFVEGLSIG